MVVHREVLVPAVGTADPDEVVEGRVVVIEGVSQHRRGNNDEISDGSGQEPRLEDHAFVPEEEEDRRCAEVDQRHAVEPEAESPEEAHREEAEPGPARR